MTKEPHQKRYGHPAKSGLWAAFNANKMDRRTRLARLIERTKARLIAELGGIASLTVQQEIVVDRASVKRAKCELYEMGVLSDPQNGMGSKSHYLALANSLRLDLAILFPDGLKARPKKVPSLQDFLKERERAKETV
ncbi:MAG: hypothetical protein ACLQGU_02580 [bacterium]